MLFKIFAGLFGRHTCEQLLDLLQSSRLRERSTSHCCQHFCASVIMGDRHHGLHQPSFRVVTNTVELFRPSPPPSSRVWNTAWHDGPIILREIVPRSIRRRSTQTTTRSIFEKQCLLYAEVQLPKTPQAGLTKRTLKSQGSRTAMFLHCAAAELREQTACTVRCTCGNNLAS